jgi:uncharacterized protein (DUF2461 family)
LTRRTEPLDVPAAFRFLRGLKRNNDRAWFHANRAAWDEHVRHGFEDLVTMLLLAGAQADDRLAHVDPRAFDRILAAKAMRRYLPLDTEPLRVTPRGFPKQHPRMPLIRARNYLVRRDVTDRELRDRGAFAVFRDAIRTTAPFVRWLDAHAAVARDEGDFD